MNLVDRPLPFTDLSRRSRCARAFAFVTVAMVVAIACSYSISAQDSPWSARMADSTIRLWPVAADAQPDAAPAWDLNLGIRLQSLEAVWHNTRNSDQLKYIKDSVDQFVSPDGSSIRTYDPRKFSIDELVLGRQLLFLYAQTHVARYRTAAALMRQQIALQPRTPEGGFWHGASYAQQMGLDNLYMIEPFYAEYAHTFNEPADFDDITKQFVLTEAHLRDPNTGLLYPMWDEAHDEPWADKTTGASPVLWSRAMGWCMMALVDTIPYYKATDPGRAKLVAILNRLAAAIMRYQDPGTGLWYEVTDQPNAPGNYLESSAACMFVYALAKGARLGYLPARDSENAKRAYQGILQQFVTVDADGSVTLNGTVKGVGLTPEQTRDNSYAHYVSASAIVSNDPKGVGAFLLASVEIETHSRGDQQ
jgi:unsaturated rhamnogalacturonyl hydrolase